MSDSDDESDDELLNFGLIHSSSSSSSSDCNANTISSISVAGQKRERKQTTRLVDEGKAEKSKEYSLEHLMRASDRNTKKLQKVGHASSKAAIDEVLSSSIDWDFIKASSGGSTADEQKPCNQESILRNSSINGNIHLWDDEWQDEDGEDDDDGEEFDDMGDLDGKLRNVYRGAKSLLCRQSAIWPSTFRLKFDLTAAKSEQGTKKLHRFYENLADLSSDPMGSAKELTELLSSPVNGIAMKLHALTDPECRQSSTIVCFVPRVLWNWLMDLVAFHPNDGVVTAASFALKSILQCLPSPTDMVNPEKAGVWQSVRLLNFPCVCRPLICLGLDVMADDPTFTSTTTVVNIARSDSSSSSTESSVDTCAVPSGLKSHLHLGEVVQPFFSGRNLCALLDVWACCVESGFHSLSGEEALDIFNACCLIGADALALSIPSLIFHKDRLASALLLILPSPGIWPTQTIRRVTALVRAAEDIDLKMVILRSLPLAQTGSRGRTLLASVIAEIAVPMFLSESTPDKDFRETSCVATALLEKFHTDKSIREYLKKKSTKDLRILITTIDLLLIAGSAPTDFSVPKLNQKMEEVRVDKFYAFMS